MLGVILSVIATVGILGKIKNQYLKGQIPSVFK